MPKIKEKPRETSFRALYPAGPHLGVRSCFWQNLESKNRFCVFLLKSKNGSRIQRIYALSGFFRSNLIRIFKIHDSSVFWETIRNSTSDKRSSGPCKFLSRHIFSRSCLTEPSIVEKKMVVIIPFRIKF